MTFDFHPTASAQQLADVIPYGLAIINQNYELVSENLMFRALMPSSNPEFLPRWLQSIHPDDVARVNACFNTVRSTEAPLRVDYRTRNQDAWCVLTLTHLANSHYFGINAHDGFLVTVADITPEKRAEFLQKKFAKDALEHKILQEQFIDMISHEIRNPLSAILHCTEDIIEATDEKGHHLVPLPRIKESAETICLCISHQKRILDDVLTSSKIDASMLLLSPRRVQPKSYFARPISLFRAQLQRNKIQFEYQADFSYADCGIEWVMADPDRMSQVLMNLLSNAIKFTARSEQTREIRVSIGASRDRPSSYPPNVVFFRSDETALSLDKTASPEWGDGEFAYVMLAVKDTGIGIDDQAQMRLFERFNQATPRMQGAYGGSGLGLNVSRKLCHLHGGEIGVSSREGEGSTFGFFFRVHKGEAPSDDSVDAGKILEMDKLSHDMQALGTDSSNVEGPTPDVRIQDDPPVSHVSELSRGSPWDEKTRHTHDIARRADANEDDLSQNDGQASPRILVVDDNPINRRILARKLNSLGYQVIVANNGLEALNAFQHSRLDCILMDQAMPVMDGNEATKRIRELENGTITHIPILGVTANVRTAQKMEMLNVGMDDIIHKPFHTKEIVAKISQFVPATLEMTQR